MTTKKRPIILEIHKDDAFYNDRKDFIGKSAIGIRQIQHRHSLFYINEEDGEKIDGFVSAKIYVNKKWFLFYGVRLSYIPEKFNL
jgi:hypothetical protein